MRRSQPSTLLAWLLLGMIALIAYGSLYPFNLKYGHAHDTVWNAFKQLSWARAGRADRVSNVLLYVPLGFCAFLWLRPRMRRLWRSGAAATLFGGFFSFCIEVTQVYISARVPSWLDVALNACGSLLGALGAVAWRNLSARVYLPSSARPTARDRSALVVLLLWFAWRLTPFAPDINLAKLKLALQPLLHFQFTLVLALKFLVFWLVAAQAVIALASRERSIEILLALIAVVLTGRLLFVTPAFVPSELLALLLLLPALVLLHRLSLPQSAITLFALALVYAAENLAPFHPGGMQGRFDLWPFIPWIEADMSIDLNALLRKLFVFAALAWLLKDVGVPGKAAALAATAFVLAVEVLKLWLPDKEASITNPSLAFATGAVLYYASMTPGGRSMRAYRASTK